MEDDGMSQERILKALINLGLKPPDARVYLYLATSGAQSTRDIAEALKLRKPQLHNSLKRLCSREIVNATPAHPVTYSAVSFPTVIELFLRAKKKEANGIEQNRNEILSYWGSM